MAGSSRSRRQRTKTKHYTDDDPSTFTTKEKKGAVGAAHASIPVERRRGRGQVLANPHQAQRTSITPVKKRPRPRPRKIHSPEPSPESAYIFLDHYVRIAPLFQSTEPPHSVINGRGLGIPPPLKTPSWQLQPLPKVSARCFSDSESTTNGTTFSRAPTCLTSNDIYLAMGDTAGFVAVYLLAPKLIMVTRLTTSASKRETLEDEALPPSKRFGQYQKKIHPNQIEKIAMSKPSQSSNRRAYQVVVATKQEVELLDMYTNTILWTFPIDLSIHALDIHPQSYQVLCSVISDSKNDTQQCQPNQLQALNNTPLWLMDIVDEDLRLVLVQPKTNENAPLRLGNRCSAVWDKSDPNCFLMVTLVLRPDDTTEQELLQIQSSSLTILQQIVVPNKSAGKSGCHFIDSISQSPTGHLTLVSSTKGIQLIETATFQILRVFGDAVALHGNSLLFQQACFVPKASQMHFQTSADEKVVDDSLDNVWIMGVPFANREPREFRDVLHLWDLWDGKQTFMTLAGPPRTEGFIRVECLPNQLIVVTQSGQLFRMAATCSSNFGGNMFPAGYQVVNDNVEYLEDEDEVDVVITKDSFEEESDDDGEKDEVVLDDDVAEALRLSMMEVHDAKIETGPDDEDEEIIDVVSGSETKLSFLPCRPEPYLTQLLKSGSSAISTASNSSAALPASFVTSLLHSMPNLQEAIEAKQDHPISEEPKAQAKVIRAKRSKVASVEALRRSSVDPDLRRVIMSRQAWSDASGSHLESLQWAEKIERQEDAAGKASNGPMAESTDAKSGQSPPVEIDPAAVSPSDGSVKSERRNGQLVVWTENGNGATRGVSQEVRMDVTAALLMSANGELDSPIGESNQPVGMDVGADMGEMCEFSPQSKKRAATPSPACLACLGRFVYHTCTKKEKPVDYEEIERADEERKEKEEEEKRQARAEKRRLADAKRREARKKKKKKIEEDARIRREEMERARWEMENLQQDVENSRLHNDDKDRRRADMLLRLQEAEQEQSTSAGWPAPVQPYVKESPNIGLSYQPLYTAAQTEWPVPHPQETISYTSGWPPLTHHGSQKELAAVAVPLAANWPQTTSTQVGKATNSDSYYQRTQVWPLTAGGESAPKETSATPIPRDFTVAAAALAYETPAYVASEQDEAFTTTKYTTGENSDGTLRPAISDKPELSKQIPEETMPGQRQAYTQSYYSSATIEGNEPAAAHSQPNSRETPNCDRVETAPDNAGGDANGPGHSYSSNYYGSSRTGDMSSSAIASHHYGDISTTEPSAPLTGRYHSADQCGVSSTPSEYYSSAPASAYERGPPTTASDSGQEYAHVRTQAPDYSAAYYDTGPVTAARSMYYNAEPEHSAGADVELHPRGREGDDDAESRMEQSYGDSSSRYYSPKATSEMLDPATALASLAMFATTAVPLASTGEYDNGEESYSGGIGQYHHAQQVYEQDDRPGYVSHNNGWGNPANADQTHQGTSH